MYYRNHFPILYPPPLSLPLSPLLLSLSLRALLISVILIMDCVFFSQQKDFVGLSFPTISSVGPNGAIIHYRSVQV